MCVRMCSGNAQPSDRSCLSSTSGAPAGMRAEAYRSVADAHGQLWHRCGKSLSTVICHGPRRPDEAKMRFAMAAPVAWSCLTDGARLVNTFYIPQTAIRPFEFAEVISMNPLTALWMTDVN